MKERQLPFSAPMVRAILDGRKTQTRRAIKPQPKGGIVRDACLAEGNPPLNGCYWEYGGPIIYSPYGRRGDRLWVREAWRVGKGYDDVPGSAFTSPTVWYEADGNLPLDRVGRYRHARFMPRWASRITLEVTGVRVERLQDITAEDCIAEGLSTTLREHDAVCALRDQFRDLWESINGAGSWDANPWVWAVEFRRIAQEAKAA